MLRQLDRTVPARQVAVFRIAIGVAALAKSYDLARGMSQHGAFDPDALTWLLPSLPGEVFPLLLAGWQLGAVMLILGVLPRLSSLGLTAMYVYLVYAGGQYANHFHFLAICLALLAVTDSGARYSSRARRGHGRERVPAWPVVLLMLHLSLVYFYAAIQKLNPTFLSGTAIESLASRAMLWPTIDPGPVWFYVTLGVGVVVWELTAPVALWIRRLKPVWFALGPVFHGGMLFALSTSWARFYRLGVFMAASLACYLLFVNGEPGSRVLARDPDCRVCSRWAGRLGRLDWLHAIRITGTTEHDREVTGGRGDTHSLRLLDDRGRTYQGFDAITVCLQALPATFLLAPWLRLPGLRQLARSAYGAMTARHACPQE